MMPEWIEPGSGADFTFTGRGSLLFWPFLSGGGMAVNLVFLGLVSRECHPWLGLSLVVLGMLVGAFYVILARAFSWSSMHRRGECLVLVPVGMGIPGKRLLFAAVSPQFLQGRLEVPLRQACLEWQGDKLLLHGHADGDLRIARGEAALRALEWLKRQGVPDPGPRRST